MGFSRQAPWSGSPFAFPGDLPNPGIEPGFPALQPDSLSSESPVINKVTHTKKIRPKRKYIFPESREIVIVLLFIK